MSQYGVIYRMEFKNVEGDTIRVNISPTDILIDDADEPTIYILTGSGTPVVVSASDNDQDKLTPIRSKSAKIQFISDTSGGLDSATFSQGADNLWVCDIILQDTPAYIFRGFLIMADNQQPFQPDPQYVTLTATDHLAALKEVALQDLSGDNPQGKYRVADLVTFCLRKTGLSLDLFVVNNLRAGSGQMSTQAITFSGPGNYFVTNGLLTNFFYEGQEITIAGSASNNGTFIVTDVDNSGLVTQVTTTATVISESVTPTITDTASDSHWYDNVYIDAKTFEKEIGESEDCYTVLEKILGEDCFITQWLGNWWIFRVDEMEDNPVYVAEFDQDGVYVSTAAGTQYSKTVGRNAIYAFANADTLLRFIRPHGFIKETFNFDFPLEIPCNVDFERGDLNATVSPIQKRYNLDCWTIKQGIGGGSVPPLVTPYIERIFDFNDYETERYAVIPMPPDISTALHYIESEAIQVQINDRFSFSVDFAWSGDASSGAAYNEAVMTIRLEGDDGSHWTVDDDGVWYQSNSGWSTNFKYIEENFVPDSVDETEFRTKNVDAKDIPVSGNIIIMLYALNQNSGSGVDDYDIYFNNAGFDYIPFINGSYQDYSGQYSKVTRTETGYMPNRDKQVYISDSPAPLLKGSMFLLIDSVYKLFPNWFSASVHGNSYPPSDDWIHPYGYIQAFSVWNQYKGYNNNLDRGIGINVFSGSVRGLTSSWPDLLYRYTLEDVNAQTINRYFILISMEQDWRSCIWRATFVEVYNRVILKSYDDPFEFKYISQ